MLLIRVVLYMIVRPIGYEFWVLPDILDDALFPLYSFDKSEDGKWGYLFRISLLLLIGYMFYEVTKDPAMVKDAIEGAAQSHDDLVSWGRVQFGIDKVENPLKNAINYDKDLLEDIEDQNETKSEGSQGQDSNQDSQGGSTKDNDVSDTKGDL